MQKNVFECLVCAITMLYNMVATQTCNYEVLEMWLEWLSKRSFYFI